MRVPSNTIRFSYGYVFYGTKLEGTLRLPNGMTATSQYAFSKLRSSAPITVIFPPEITSAGDVVNGSESQRYRFISVFLSTTPPTLSTQAHYNSVGTIYVPDTSIDAYKTASTWSHYTGGGGRFKPLSDYEGEL